MPFSFANWASAIAERRSLAGVRTKFRFPVGYLCWRSSGKVSPRTRRVSPVTVAAGLIIASGPFGAWLAIGISWLEHWDQPLIMPITSGLRA